MKSVGLARNCYFSTLSFSVQCNVPFWNTVIELELAVALMMFMSCYLESSHHWRMKRRADYLYRLLVAPN